MLRTWNTKVVTVRALDGFAQALSRESTTKRVVLCFSSSMLLFRIFSP